MAQPRHRHPLLAPARWRCAGVFAAQALGAARQRTWLAVAGIAVGVAAVVALLTIGQGAQQQALAEFESMGTQVVHLLLNPEGGTPAERVLGRGLRPPEAALPHPRGQAPLGDLLQALREVELASELMPVSCEAAGPGSRSPQFHAVRPALQRILGLKLAQGRFLHPADGAAMWLVVGHSMARQLRGEGLDLRPGAAMPLCGRTFFIAGVLAPASSPEAMTSVDIDEALFISVPAALRLGPPDPAGAWLLRLSQDAAPLAFAARLQPLLAQRLGGSPQVTAAQKVIDLRRRQAAGHTRFLAALAAVSLAVGGLGILNIMLVAVVERRREIGLRLAIGADESDIAMQFLVESALLALAGGLCGAVAGALAALGVLWVNHMPMVLSAGAMGMALSLSLLVGVASGWYPAALASRQEPASALQSH